MTDDLKALCLRFNSVLKDCVGEATVADDNRAGGMPRSEAIELLGQAFWRIALRNPGEKEATGGAYWRLSKVLSLYLLPRLAEVEGTEHAVHIVQNHGIPLVSREPVGIDMDVAPDALLPGEQITVTRMPYA